LKLLSRRLPDHPTNSDIQERIALLLAQDVGPYDWFYLLSRAFLAELLGYVNTPAHDVHRRDAELAVRYSDFFESGVRAMESGQDGELTKSGNGIASLIREILSC
jgi:hypothetical protein